MAYELSNMKKKIENHMKNYYLDLHLGKPRVSEDKLNVLLNVFDNATACKANRDTYILTTMLVQTALDTHDSIAVRNNEIEGEQASQETQLTVLAGDYYSGLYYYLLSQTEDIAFIRLLAEAIKEINELKMTLYHMEITSFEEFASLHGKIAGHIIVCAARFAGVDEATRTWMEQYIEMTSYMDEVEDFGESGENVIYNQWLAGKSAMSENDYEAGRAQRLNALTDQFRSCNDDLFDSLCERALERSWRLQNEWHIGKEG